jgi:hypothetical protein
MGARSYWSRPIPGFPIADGPSVTAASPTADPIIVPAYLLEKGCRLILDAQGVLTSTSATPTVILGFYYGGTAGVALAVSAAMAINVAATAWPWMMHWEGKVRATGATGSIKGMGRLSSGFGASGGLSAAFDDRPIPITDALRTVTIDTTTRKQLSVGCTLSSVTGTPTVICTDFAAEIRG